MSVESIETKGAGGHLEFLGNLIGRPLQNWGARQAQKVAKAGQFVATLGKKTESRSS